MMRLTPGHAGHRALALLLVICAHLFSVSAPDSAAAESSLASQGSFPYDAFEALPAEPRLTGPAAALDIRFGPGPLAASKADILAWIDTSARAIASYYGRFPAKPARLLIVPADGTGVQRGETYGYQGAAIRIVLGRDTRADYFARDWVLVHEMVHTTFPELDDRHSWLHEGLATYIEPIARAQTGGLTEARVWQDLVENLPHGLPEAGDKGLDYTHTWGRTYWGGALFWLLADIEIHKRSNGRRSRPKRSKAPTTSTSSATATISRCLSSRRPV